MVLKSRLEKLTRTETYLFKTMQGVTAIHTRTSGNFKQFCSLVWVHLDLLVVFFPSLADVGSEILDLSGKNEILGLNIFMIKSNQRQAQGINKIYRYTPF